MTKNKKSSVKNKRIAIKKSLMQSMLARLKTKAANYLSPKSLSRHPALTNGNDKNCEQKTPQESEAPPIINHAEMKEETDDVSFQENAFLKSASCPNLQVVNYHQANETTIDRYSSSKHASNCIHELHVTTKTETYLTQEKYSINKPVYPSRVSLSRGLDLVATMCFHGLVTISRAFAGVQSAKSCTEQRSIDNYRLNRLESQIQAHDVEITRLRELIEKMGKNPTTNPLPPFPLPTPSLLHPPPLPPPPPPPLPPAIPVVANLAAVTPKVVKRDPKENLRLLRPCISQEDLRAVKLRCTPLNNTKKPSNVGMTTPRVTLEALRSVKLKRSDSEKICLTPAKDENVGAIPLKTLKKVNIVRSPGGTPLRSLPTENNFNQDYSGSEGLTPLMTRALQKRMAAWKGPSPTNSPTSNDSF